MMMNSLLLVGENGLFKLIIAFVADQSGLFVALLLNMNGKTITITLIIWDLTTRRHKNYLRKFLQ